MTCSAPLISGKWSPGRWCAFRGRGSNPFTSLRLKQQQSCIFEHVYFARPDSRVFGRSVHHSREMFGRLLAREHPVPADVVVPVPDSGVPAAIGYGLESGIPFRMGLIRNHYIGRTFIQPAQSIRDFGVKLKLNPVRDLLEGKRVILVDDSIVRGTTSRKIVRMVREAGATEVHVRISSPPTISPVLLRHRYANARRIDRVIQFENSPANCRCAEAGAGAERRDKESADSRGNPAFSRRGFARLSFAREAARRGRRTAKAASALRALPESIRRSRCNSKWSTRKIRPTAKTRRR